MLQSSLFLCKRHFVTIRIVSLDRYMFGWRNRACTATRRPKSWFSTAFLHSNKLITVPDIPSSDYYSMTCNYTTACFHASVKICKRRSAYGFVLPASVNVRSPIVSDPCWGQNGATFRGAIFQGAKAWVGINPKRDQKVQPPVCPS